MKALSVKQPWAWAIIEGLKDIENRGWCCWHKGPLLIHTGKQFDDEGYYFLQHFWDDAYMNPEDKPRIPLKQEYVLGSIIGKVLMVDCIHHDHLTYKYNPWFFRPWGFVFIKPTKFKNPIPYKGRLGIFGVPGGYYKEEEK